VCVVCVCCVSVLCVCCVCCVCVLCVCVCVVCVCVCANIHTYMFVCIHTYIHRVSGELTCRSAACVLSHVRAFMCVCVCVCVCVFVHTYIHSPGIQIWSLYLTTTTTRPHDTCCRVSALGGHVVGRGDDGGGELGGGGREREGEAGGARACCT
jgi:hypothetical protein